MVKKPKYSLWVLVVLVAIDFIGRADGKRIVLSTRRRLEVEGKLKLLNKPAIKSIEGEDGDIIDCVDIYKQPALNHPLLRNHTIQMKPSDKQKQATQEAAPHPKGPLPSSMPMASQVWQKSGSCPVGTIPIRRVQERHLLGASRIGDFGKKVTQMIKPKRLSILNDSSILGIEANHSFDVMVAQGYSYAGAKADINTWNPNVEADDEYSSAQIWLMSGPFNDSDSIEVGWMVNPSVYGDRSTRLFAYWTRDSGRTTGCFDLLCPGFVQTNNELALGGQLDQISSLQGIQYHITVYVYKDFNSGNWWLEVNNLALGYWPANLFNNLDHIATLVKWGGDVYSPRMGMTPHTSTAMGSGKFAEQHYGGACFIRWPRVLDYSLNLKYPDNAALLGLEYYCYNINNYAERLFTEPTLFFGGPGRNYLCP